MSCVLWVVCEIGAAFSGDIVLRRGFESGVWEEVDFGGSRRVKPVMSRPMGRAATALPRLGIYDEGSGFVTGNPL